MYAVYHGPEGLKRIAHIVHDHTHRVAVAADKLGYSLFDPVYFDTVTFTLPASASIEKVRTAAEARGINFRYGKDRITIAFDETVRDADVTDVIASLAEACGEKPFQVQAKEHPQCFLISSAK